MLPPCLSSLPPSPTKQPTDQPTNPTPLFDYHAAAYAQKLGSPSLGLARHRWRCPTRCCFPRRRCGSPRRQGPASRRVSSCQSPWLFWLIWRPFDSSLTSTPISSSRSHDDCRTRRRSFPARRLQARQQGARPPCRPRSHLARLLSSRDGGPRR